MNKKNKFNRLIVSFLLLTIGLACSQEKSAPKDEKDGSRTETAGKPKKLESYSFKGLTFSYYLIPGGLGREELLATAKEIHEGEPDAQLILVDDETGLSDYIEYAKGVSAGKADVELPKEWADRHIIANLQKFLSGKWMLYKGYGYEEIGEIK
ncbi:MAG: hypothetical protein R2747_00495 [Pyrinomonadaceae bacterium]